MKTLVLALLTTLVCELQPVASAQERAEPTVDWTSTDRRRVVRGQLLARTYTTLSSEIAGKIATISVKDGDRFNIESPLIVLDCAVQQAQLDEAVASLRAAAATRQVNQRLRQLNSAADLEIELALAEEAKAQARVSAMRSILSKCNISAPFRGKVAELKVQPLQYVQPGQPVLDLVDDSAFEVEFLAPSSWLRWLAIGQAFEIKVDETASAYHAKVIRIGGRVDAVSETVKVYGALLVTTPDLVPGMSGEILFK